MMSYLSAAIHRLDNGDMRLVVKWFVDPLTLTDAQRGQIQQELTAWLASQAIGELG